MTRVITALATYRRGYKMKARFVRPLQIFLTCLFGLAPILSLTSCAQSQPDNVALLKQALDKDEKGANQYDCNIYFREIDSGKSPDQAGAYLAELNWYDAIASVVLPGGSTPITRGQWRDAFVQWHAENC